MDSLMSAFAPWWAHAIIQGLCLTLLLWLWVSLFRDMD